MIDGISYSGSLDIHIPTRIEFGWGKVASLADYIQTDIRRILLICFPGFENSAVLRKCLQTLKSRGCSCHVHSDVESDPDCSAVDAFGKFARTEKFELIIAFGGGSVIDFAKGTAIAASQVDNVWSYVDYTGKQGRSISGNILPVIAIPTTAGTGSEVTPYAVLSNHAENIKATIKDTRIFPLLAVVDPELSATMPPALTAMTGADAFAHALESFLNVPKKQFLSDALAMQALRIIGKHLVRSVTDGKDEAARCGMALGSLLGGVAIATVGTGACHGIAQVMGGIHGIPHGQAVAALLPGVLRVVGPVFQSLWSEINDLFPDEKDMAMSVENLFASIGLATNLKEFGIHRDDFSEIIKDTLGYMGRTLACNPRQLNAEDVAAILEYSWKE